MTVSPFRASECPDRVCPGLHGPAHSRGGPASSAAAPGESGVPAHPTEVSSVGLGLDAPCLSGAPWLQG